jgi:site-specific DNA-methyltransferase (adenine-specific)
MDKLRLLLGDSTVLLKDIPDSSVDLVLTDPPYGINYRSNRQRVDRKRSVTENQSVVVRQHYFNKIANDSDETSVGWLKDVYRVLRNNSAMYIFTHWSRWSATEDAVKNAGFAVKNMIVLNKSNHGMGDLSGSYAPKHELLMFAAKGRHVMRFPNGRQTDIWNVPVIFSGSKRCHPNEKPISWLFPAIQNSADAGATVLDPFMGSGSTGVAAIKSKCVFIGMEKDEEYFKIASQRLKNTEVDNVFEEN